MEGFMGIFNTSKISIDQIDGYLNNLTNQELFHRFREEWVEFANFNTNLWIKEKTELDMILDMNFESISVTLDYLLSSRDQKKLKEKTDRFNKATVTYACLLGVGYSVINKEEISTINQFSSEFQQVFDLTYLPSYKLFEIVFDAHYKVNSHMAFQRDGHLEDTKRAITTRTWRACKEGSKAVGKLNYLVF
jgi:hypothetical protein